MKLHCFLIFTLMCLTQPFEAQNLSENTTGSFVFTPQNPINRPPVEIFYHIPDGDITTMPILMSFHGAGRDGDNYRNYWINMANANGFMVFAPEFTSANYPGLGDNYIMSNIFDDGDNPSPETFNDQNEWTCSVLDPLFDFIVDDISGTQETYNAWGHSAGSQFLHRLFMYLPNNKIDVAVCSNAGWYTVPETGVSFPYGIDNGQLPMSDLTTAFSKKLIVHLGQNDTDPNSGLRRNEVVDTQQGVQRLERGRYFYNTSQATSQTMTVPFNWEKHEAANVGHDAQLMANDALQYFLPSFLSIDKTEENQSTIIYPNPTHTGAISIVSQKDEGMTVHVFDILGKHIKSEVLATNTLNVSNLVTGVYILKIIQNNATSTKKLVIK